LSSNPQSARWIVTLTALYLHLGPFSRFVIDQIDPKIEALETSALDPHSTDSNGPIKKTALQRI
jgi:hypothetical protein